MTAKASAGLSTGKCVQRELNLTGTDASRVLVEESAVQLWRQYKCLSANEAISQAGCRELRVMGGLADVRPGLQSKGRAAGTLLYLEDTGSNLKDKANDSSQTGA